jgi:pyruvate/2-oxoglutarate dehydrogenase complex dihydrolipoamide acyltransferase (E2) component
MRNKTPGDERKMVLCRVLPGKKISQRVGKKGMRYFEEDDEINLTLSQFRAFRDCVEPADQAPAKADPADPYEDIDATQSAIELAKANGIDLKSVKGSGQGGKILKKDVEVLVKKPAKKDA